jgi:thioredoxin reductase (NADPH)
VLVRERASGATERIETTGLFVMIGAEPHTEPHTEWLDGAVELDEGGFVLSGGDVQQGEQLDRGHDHAGRWPLDRAPALFETSAPGVFAAGDVRHGSVKRVTTAMGEGATVIQLVNHYLAEHEPVGQRQPVGPPALVGAS